MNKNESAEKDYMSGMKYKDIADKYGVSINTVKSWKKTVQLGEKKRGAHKIKNGCTQKNVRKKTL
jgi:phage terminase small subunit